MGEPMYRVAPSWLLPVAGILLLCTFVYYRFQPKPIPGIPYNKGIGFFGDLPELLSVVLSGKSARPWFWGMATRHNSPVTQFVLRPFDKPTVIVVDYRETHDILFRRGKEFDRSKRSTEIFSTIVPNHHIAMQSSNPQFRGNKELVRDLMTPGFLHNVSAPTVYSKVQDLVDLWAFKARVADGRPFAAFQDTSEAFMDAIMAVVFGEKRGREIMRLELEHLTRKEEPATTGEICVFPQIALPRDIEALSVVNSSLSVSLSSPIPHLHHWIMRKTKWRKCFARKEQIITDEINEAVVRLSAAEDKAAACKCAMDHMVMRELAASEKAGREPAFHTPSMRDELFGFLIAGHETSSTTLAWIFKTLSDSSVIQSKLRAQLHKTFGAANAENRPPTVTEIIRHEAPYLNAFIQESFRLAKTIPILMRDTTCDTTILGHSIPKDTTVMFLTLGPSITEPSVSVSNEARSESSLKSRARVADWDDATIDIFKPERWLKAKQDGPATDDELESVEYDPQAGPIITFGGGPRGCFGQRLAYLQLRITIALLVWNFEFQPCPPELSSYDGSDVLTTIPKQCYVRLKKL